MSHNYISDISDLSHCPSLQFVNLSHNRLESLHGLTPLKNL
jgi:Leucine-rich repeat (LRR) protein